MDRTYRENFPCNGLCFSERWLWRCDLLPDQSPNLGCGREEEEEEEEEEKEEEELRKRREKGKR